MAAQDEKVQNLSKKEKVKSFIKKYTGWMYSTKRRKIVLGIIIILVVISQINSARKPDFETDLYIIEKQRLVEKVTASGEIKADKSIDLGFLQAGQIDDIYVKDGAYVTDNQKIAKIDSNKLYQSLMSSDAALRNTQATLDRVYDDVKDNDDDESLTEKETRTAAETAKDQAYRAFAISQINLSDGTMNAPFSGIVNYKDGISIGSYASALTPSFSLVDLDTIFFEAKVNEIDVSKISENSKALIELDAFPDKTFEQNVQSIGVVKTITSSGGTAYKVRVTLPHNINNKFRLGMNGDIEFIVSESENVITIPISSVVEEDEISYVWIVNGGGKVTKIMVETGTSSIDDIQILSGLNEGDIVVIRPPSKIEEGDKVKSENGVDAPTGFLGLF